MKAKKIILSLIAFYGILLITNIAFGQKAMIEAQGHYRAGEALYKIGRYEEAVREFLAGYDLSGKPLFLFNIGQCYKKIGQLEQAKSYFEEFIRRDPNSPYKKLAEEEIKEIDKMMEEELKKRLEEERKRKEEEKKREELIKKEKPAIETEGKVEVTEKEAEIEEKVMVKKEEKPPIYKKWWFWTIIGGIVVGGGVGAGVAIVSTQSRSSYTNGSIDTIDLR